MRLAFPLPLPAARWALTPPFHPYPFTGGLFSAALSVMSAKTHCVSALSPGRYPASCPAEPGLSSSSGKKPEKAAVGHRS